MSYEIAIKKAWDELIKAAGSANLTVKFLADEYTADPASRKVLSLACNVPAKDFSAILILHYLIRKYGAGPEGLYSVIGRLPARRSAQQADAGIEVEAFSGVPVLVLLWKGDDEFGPEANILFDRSIASVFCTEDIVVLGGMVAAALENIARRLFGNEKALYSGNGGCVRGLCLYGCGCRRVFLRQDP